jgi:hypothetical protein
LVPGLQESLQIATFRPGLLLPCELMFDQTRNRIRRLADAADLIIDFATLGEYGLEPVAAPDSTECTGGRRRPTPGRLSGHSATPALAAARR